MSREGQCHVQRAGARRGWLGVSPVSTHFQEWGFQQLQATLLHRGAYTPGRCWLTGFVLSCFEGVASQESQEKMGPSPLLCSSLRWSAPDTAGDLYGHKIWAVSSRRQGCLRHESISNMSEMFSRPLEGELNV